MSRKTLYSVLGVSAGATPKEIDAALARHLADPALDPAMRVAVREAHGVLGNMERRNAYDTRLRDEADVAKGLSHSLGAQPSLVEPGNRGWIWLALVAGAFILGAVTLAHALRDHSGSHSTGELSRYDQAMQRQREVNEKIEAHRREALDEIQQAQQHPSEQPETEYERNQRAREANDARTAERLAAMEKERSAEAAEQREAERLAAKERVDAEAHERNQERLARDAAYLKQLEEDNQRVRLR